MLSISADAEAQSCVNVNNVNVNGWVETEHSRWVRLCTSLSLLSSCGVPHSK